MNNIGYKLNNFVSEAYPSLGSSSNSVQMSQQKKDKILFYSGAVITAIAFIIFASLIFAARITTHRCPDGPGVPISLFERFLYCSVGSPLLLFSVGLALYASRIWDYKDPVALEKMRKAATRELASGKEELALDKLLFEHGPNLARYEILPKEKIEALQRRGNQGEELRKQNREAFEKSLEYIDKEYPLGKKRSEDLTSWQYQLEAARVRETLCERVGRGSSWVSQERSEIWKQVKGKYPVLEDPEARKQQGSYDLHRRELTRQYYNNENFIFQQFLKFKILDVK